MNAVARVGSRHRSCSWGGMGGGTLNGVFQNDAFN